MPINYGTEEAAADSNEASGLKGIAYASDSSAQVLDLHLPEGDGPFFVIVVVRGGGFRFGSPDMSVIQPIFAAAVNRGYAVASIDYR